MINFTDGGVCAAKGFRAAGLHVGVKTRNKDKKDLALIIADCDCAAGAVYTKNVVKAAPLIITKDNLKNGRARVIFANSGNANACAPNGEKHALDMCKAAADKLGLDKRDVIVASTGVIGQELPIDTIKGGIGELVDNLSYDGSAAAAEAIMTTDLAKKELAVEFTVGGKTARIGGIAKGSGMIHPNMGTMLAFLTTDCAISSEMIQIALINATNVSFNRVTVDGDTSTNDMLCLLSNGMAGNEQITAFGIDYDAFADALNSLCTQLAIMIADDGEGASHLITCRVHGARTVEEAETLSKSVISSPLTKTAIFGSDANWGRVLCALGYSGIEFAPSNVDISFESDAGRILVCKNGCGLSFDETLAKAILTRRNVTIDINMNIGEKECTCWGCDLTYDYVRINGDYRS